MKSSFWLLLVLLSVAAIGCESSSEPVENTDDVGSEGPKIDMGTPSTSFDGNNGSVTPDQGSGQPETTGKEIPEGSGPTPTGEEGEPKKAGGGESGSLELEPPKNAPAPKE